VKLFCYQAAAVRCLLITEQKPRGFKRVWHVTDRQTDRQMDMLPIAKSCSSTAECDNQ